MFCGYESLRMVLFTYLDTWISQTDKPGSTLKLSLDLQIKDIHHQPPHTFPPWGGGYLTSFLNHNIFAIFSISLSYMTGVTAAQLQLHLSNMNVNQRIWKVFFFKINYDRSTKDQRVPPTPGLFPNPGTCTMLICIFSWPAGLLCHTQSGWSSSWYIRPCHTNLHN